jgi:hypothetical protein
MKNYWNYLVMGLLALACGLAGCRKGFLEDKPSKSLLVPSAPADFRALLDNLNVFNVSPALPGIADGDFYTTDAGWLSYQDEAERRSYTWAADIFGTEATADWNVPYQQVFYANVVLDGLDALPAGTAGAAELRGTALFCRGTAFFNLAQEFCAGYQEPAAAGLPLRLSPDVTLRVGRSAVAATYGQLLADLLSARRLLPVVTGYKSRPTQLAALAMLARVYLAMGDYDRAGRYADSALARSPALLDYNTLSAAARRPFPRALPDGNDEVIWYCAQASYFFNLSSAPTYADSLLYGAYAADDLRKALFFTLKPDGAAFRGNYNGSLLLFSGLATDELYLVRAECRARRGDAAGALADLNTLLAMRWRAGAFVPLAAAGPGAALALALAERRKELLGRGLRWSDLRRLNREPALAVTLERRLNGSRYTLLPGALRYVFPLPLQETSLSGLPQNPR